MPQATHADIRMCALGAKAEEANVTRLWHSLVSKEVGGSLAVGEPMAAGELRAAIDGWPQITHLTAIVDVTRRIRC